MTHFLMMMMSLFSEAAHSQPTRYSIEALGQYQFGFSELSETSSINHGPTGTIRLTVKNDSLFVFPEVSLTPLLGLEELELFNTVGIAIGSALPFWDLSVYGGIESASIIGYKVNSTALFRLGGFFPWKDNLFFNIETKLGTFKEEQSAKTIKYTFFSFMGGVGISFDVFQAKETKPEPVPPRRWTN